MEEYDMENDFLKHPYEVFDNHKIFALSDIGLKKYLLSKKNVNPNKKLIMKEINENNKSNSNYSSILNRNKSQLELKNCRNGTSRELHSNTKIDNKSNKNNKHNSLNKDSNSYMLKRQKSTEVLSHRFPKHFQSERKTKLKKFILYYPNTNPPNNTSSTSNAFQRFNNSLLKTIFDPEQSGFAKKNLINNDLKDTCNSSDYSNYYDILSNENKRLMKTFTNAKDKQYLLSTSLPKIHINKRVIITNFPSNPS